MTAFERYSEFVKKHGNSNFPTKALADEYATHKKEWWGGNLVVFEAKQNEAGKWNCGFNVWD